MLKLGDLSSPVSLCGGGGGGGGGNRSGHDGGRDGYAVKDSFHVNPGRGTDYASGRNSADPQGAWGRPTLDEGDAYSGDQTYGSADGR